MGISAKEVKELREQTGAGMMDCKKALTESGGDFEKAVDFLRTKGLAAAQKKQSRIAAEGTIGSYIHGGKIGVMVEVNCETDFVAKNADFKQFVKDVAMHVAAADPKFLKEENMDQNYLNREVEIYTAQLKEQGKPEKMIPKIVEGKLGKLAEEVCLYHQKFIKDTDKTINDLVNDITLKVGEKVAIRRFVKYNLGEGIEKRQDNLAEEVAKMSGK
ncbi:MAG: translation elongation factor Ts [Bdellovibrionales bacterium]|jgi:elongation factor Ts|nr:translation elongation factor Ts [Bdellovibrionales bacterium]MBT3526503.1 translation elongation factor Ts [Bdellovibrionales bacterium]MBT7670039.1 translation elongation factor Ts [Bdellovibrionales bacterium]MBT7767787.1 translation elongation factor Ts [Bdellovibrionales bacterium]